MKEHNINAVIFMSLEYVTKYVSGKKKDKSSRGKTEIT